MTEWQPSSLADLIDIKHGFAFKGKHFVDYPTDDVLVTPGNFAIGGGFKSDKLKFYDGPVPEDYVLQPGDLIVTMTDLSKQADTLGYSAIVPSTGPRLLHNQRIGLVTSRDETIGLDFLGWLMRTPAYRNCVVGSATGSTVKHTSPSRIKEFEFLLPPERDRNAISAILNALDDKIELNRRMNETLEAQARALFRDWFVDFGPVKTKMAGDAPYLAPDLWSLFPDRLDDDGLPEGWQQSVLGNHALNFDSKRVPLSKAQRSKRQGEFAYHGATSVMDYVDGYLFDGIYTLIGEDGSVADGAGRAFTQYVFGKFWVNNHAHVLQGKHPVSTEQILLYFRHEVVTPFVTGAVQLKLSQGRMNSMPFIYAGAEICEAFNHIVSPLFDRMRANELENRTLAETRDLLLPKLMSGEMRVGEAERELERA